MLLIHFIICYRLPHISFLNSFRKTSCMKHKGKTDNLRELCLQTIRHLCPCVRCSLAAPAVLLSRPPSVHVVQTLRFSRFIACFPIPFGFEALLAQNRALAEISAHVLSRPRFLSTRLALGVLGPKSLHYYIIFRDTFRKLVLKPTQSSNCALRLAL